MAAGEAATVADDGLVYGFAKRGTDSTSGNGAAQGAQNAASDNADGHAGGAGNHTDDSTDFATGGCTGHGAGDPAGSACDRADSSACLFADGSVHDAGASTRGARGARAA